MKYRNSCDGIEYDVHIKPATNPHEVNTREYRFWEIARLQDFERALLYSIEVSKHNLPKKASRLSEAQLEADKLWISSPRLSKKIVCDRLSQKGFGAYSTLYNRIKKN